MKNIHRFLAISVFAVAMAWVEAATVLDLRVLVDRLQPYQPDPLPHFGGLGPGGNHPRNGHSGDAARRRLAGRGTRTNPASLRRLRLWRVGYFYYLFLIPLTGWPKSLLDWDILFLLPVPWWGPVIAPVPSRY